MGDGLRRVPQWVLPVIMALLVGMAPGLAATVVDATPKGEDVNVTGILLLLTGLGLWMLMAFVFIVGLATTLVALVVARGRFDDRILLGAALMVGTVVGVVLGGTLVAP